MTIMMDVQKQHNDFKNSIKKGEEFKKFYFISAQYQVLDNSLKTLAATVSQSEDENLRILKTTEFLLDAQDELLSFVLNYESTSVLDIYKKLKFWEEITLKNITKDDLSFSDKLIACTIEEMKTIVPSSE